MKRFIFAFLCLILGCLESEVSISSNQPSLHFNLASPTDQAIGQPFSKLNFSWTPSYRAESYRLQIALDKDFTALVADIDQIFNQNFTVTQRLSAGTTYYWRVFSYNNGKETVSNTSFIFSTCDVEITTTENSGSGSLREVVSNIATGQVIGFHPDILNSSNRIVLGSHILIRKDLSLIGPGCDKLTLDGKNFTRLFVIDDSNEFTTLSVTIAHLKFANGNVNLGAAILNMESLKIDHCIFANNFANMWGGAIYNQGHVELSHSNFEQNSTTHGTQIDFKDRPPITFSYGGAIYNVGTMSINQCTFIENHAEFGGAINNGGKLTISDCSFCQNQAISSFIDGAGGALYIGAPTSIERTTFYNNGTDGYGGGILNYSQLTISNSTLSSNYAKKGGAIYNSTGLDLVNCTIAFNKADVGGGIYDSTAQEAKIKNTIIANNEALSHKDCFISQVSGGYNLIGDIDGYNGSTSLPTDVPHPEGGSIEPLIAPLSDNGGLTKTHAVLKESPAIDAGFPFPDAPGIDQRWKTRDSHIDIGAFEFGAK